MPAPLRPTPARRAGLPAFALLVAVASTLSATALAGQEPTTREMNLMGWQEFAEVVPARIETVLIPTGTLEPHGVLPNGSDNLAPEAMARALAPRLNALIAPTLNYGFTGSFAAFPGNLSISEATYEAFVEEILVGLAEAGFLNLVVINGHGGGQTAVLGRVAERVAQEHRVRTLVANWWSATSDVVFEVFGENGGHAGNNETAYVQAIVPEHVHPERYDPEMARARAAGIQAYPFHSSIVLYEEGQGYPDFDPAKAMEYFEKVNDRMAELVAETIRLWDLAGLHR